MERVTETTELRRRISDWKFSGRRIALVPTMGNLHAGHLSLIERARQLTSRLVCSLFVNPMQFGPNEDFESYPRTLKEDVEKLTAAGVDLLFAPSIETIYPHPMKEQTRVLVPVLGEALEGIYRPEHFEGVATLVCKLLNICLPDVAIFGQKDYQQLLIIRRLVADLSLSVEVVSAPIVREEDGLAMSSRNAYLDDGERRVAPLLYQTLRETAHKLSTGETVTNACQAAIKTLTQSGFSVDYIEARQAESLKPPTADSRQLVVLAAAQLGQVRLIDNVLLDLDEIEAID